MCHFEPNCYVTACFVSLVMETWKLYSEGGHNKIKQGEGKEWRKEKTGEGKI